MIDRYKVIQNVLKENAQLRYNLQKHPDLRFLFFEVTTRCNLACLHCGSSCTKNNGLDMPSAYVKRTIESVKKHCQSDLPMLCITGGEPLLYNELTEVMTYASKLGFTWGMTTNATLINEQKAKELYDAGLVSTTVSIDGLANNHDWFRNTPLAFKRMEKGIKALIKFAPAYARVDVLTVVNKKNISELEDIYQFVSDMGIQSWRIVNMEPIGRALQNQELMVDDNDYKILFEFIKEKHFNSQSIEVDYGCSHYLILQYERLLRPYSFICMAGLGVASIASNGDIIACLDIERRKELVQGNISHDDFWDVWINKYQFFRKDKIVLNQKCGTCEDKEFCAGDSAHTWDYDNNTPMVCMKEILKNV